MPSQRELEERVDELAGEHSGQDFADAVAAYAQDLNDEERAALEVILLQRARALEDAVSERFAAKGWLRRTIDRLSQPPGNQRNR